VPVLDHESMTQLEGDEDTIVHNELIKGENYGSLVRG
jgi:hypothetical protein